MKLGCVVLAVNDNPKYYSFWPIVKEAWMSIINVPVILYFIGDTLPSILENDPYVFKIAPIPNWPTATQAQMIRLLAPALIETDDVVLIGDIDCMPLNKDFFHDGVKVATDGQFISYRQPINDKEICMMYVAAQPKVWREIFNVSSLSDVYSTLDKWSTQYLSDGKHAGTGWTSDQLELYTRVMSLPKEKVLMHSWAYSFPRLDREMPLEWLQENVFLDSRLNYNYYIDFHMPDLEKFENQITNVLTKALFFTNQKN